jgi:SAM-dependent methyltransferase
VTPAKKGLDAISLTIKRSVVCPVCSSPERRVLFTDRNRRDRLDCVGTYVECSRCSHVYLSDPPPWQDIARFYSTMESGVQANSGRLDVESAVAVASRHTPRWKSRLRRIRVRPHSWPLRSVPPGRERLLDLGCGNGIKLIEFAQRGYEIWGVDVGADAIEVCRQVLPKGTFIRSELDQTGLPDSYFHYVRLDNALEHVGEPGATLRECLRVLIPGGTVMIYVPHGRSLSIRAMKGRSISSWIPFHLQLFTRNSLATLLRESGFEVVEIRGYSPLHWLPMSIMQLFGWNANGRARRLLSVLIVACAPMGWLAAKVGMAEELIGIGKKRLAAH